jgi:hypothetical protein
MGMAYVIQTAIPWIVFSTVVTVWTPVSWRKGVRVWQGMAYVRRSATLLPVPMMAGTVLEVAMIL